VVAALVVACGLSNRAEAIDPSKVEYRRDADSLFWFVQISDSHITLGKPGRTENLSWAAEAAVEHLDAEFVVHTGDMVDHTNGADFPVENVECYPEEWAEYRAAVEGWATSSNWFDLPGNHDQYGDDDLSCYLEWSIQGEASGRTQHAWLRQFSFGKYLFVGMATSGENGSRFPIDSPNLSDDELEFLGSALTTHADANLAVVFGHHPISGSPPLRFLDGEDRDRFVEMMLRHRASSYGYGHTGSARLGYFESLILIDLGPLKGEHYRDLALYTVDGNGLRVRQHDIGVWPIAQITAPLDTDMGGANPYAYPVTAGSISNPVRAVVFDPAGIASVRFRADDGPWLVMDRVADHVFEGEWSTIGVDPGYHFLYLDVLGASGTATDAIRVEVRVTECSDGLDNDGNGRTDFPRDSGCASPSDDTERGSRQSSTDPMNSGSRRLK